MALTVPSVAPKRTRKPKAKAPQLVARVLILDPRTLGAVRALLDSGERLVVAELSGVELRIVREVER